METVGKGRSFLLGYFLDLPVKFRGARLVETNILLHATCTNCVKDPKGPKASTSAVYSLMSKDTCTEHNHNHVIVTVDDVNVYTKCLLHTLT